MPEIHVDTLLSDSERRERLYDGGLFLHSPHESTRAFCAFARGLIADAFEGRDPETAQYDLPVESYIEILRALKPQFIHHEESKRHVRAVLETRGCDLEDTYYDVPRLRSSTSDDYLTTGIAYAWHPHRDTWYSAPSCQINWWTPVYEIAANNTVAFFPDYFDREVPNDSSGYDYQEWNKKHRFSASDHVKKDTRPLPRPHEEIPADTRTAVVCSVSGLLLFAGAQLHASIPNTSGRTRFSIDFRTVSLRDLREGRGAPTQDVFCTGTSVRDFHRASDGAAMPEDVAQMIEEKTSRVR